MTQFHQTHSNSNRNQDGTNSEASSDFLDRIAALERAASPPPVVGETLAWCRRVGHELTQLTERYPQRRQRHDALRDELAREQPAASSKLADAGQRERQLGTQLAGLHHRIDTLIASDDAGFDEPFREAKQVRVELLAWCVAARSIDAEVRTRLMETYYRDRGTVD